MKKNISLKKTSKKPSLLWIDSHEKNKTRERSKNLPRNRLDKQEEYNYDFFQVQKNRSVSKNLIKQRILSRENKQKSQSLSKFANKIFLTSVKKQTDGSDQKFKKLLSNINSYEINKEKISFQKRYMYANNKKLKENQIKKTKKSLFNVQILSSLESEISLYQNLGQKTPKGVRITEKKIKDQQIQKINESICLKKFESQKLNDCDAIETKNEQLKKSLKELKEYLNQQFKTFEVFLDDTIIWIQNIKFIFEEKVNKQFLINIKIYLFQNKYINILLQSHQISKQIDIITHSQYNLSSNHRLIVIFFILIHSTQNLFQFRPQCDYYNQYEISQYFKSFLKKYLRVDKNYFFSSINLSSIKQNRPQKKFSFILKYNSFFYLVWFDFILVNQIKGIANNILMKQSNQCEMNYQKKILYFNKQILNRANNKKIIQQMQMLLTNILIQQMVIQNNNYENEKIQSLNFANISAIKQLDIQKHNLEYDDQAIKICFTIKQHKKIFNIHRHFDYFKSFKGSINICQQNYLYIYNSGSFIKKSIISDILEYIILERLQLRIKQKLQILKMMHITNKVLFIKLIELIMKQINKINNMFFFSDSISTYQNRFYKFVMNLNYEKFQIFINLSQNHTLQFHFISLKNKLRVYKEILPLETFYYILNYMKSKKKIYIEQNSNIYNHLQTFLLFLTRQPSENYKYISIQDEIPFPDQFRRVFKKNSMKFIQHPFTIKLDENNFITGNFVTNLINNRLYVKFYVPRYQRSYIKNIDQKGKKGSFMALISQLAKQILQNMNKKSTAHKMLSKQIDAFTAVSRLTKKRYLKRTGLPMHRSSIEVSNKKIEIIEIGQSKIKQQIINKIVIINEVYYSIGIYIQNPNLQQPTELQKSIVQIEIFKQGNILFYKMSVSLFELFKNINNISNKQEKFKLNNFIEIKKLLFKLTDSIIKVIKLEKNKFSEIVTKLNQLVKNQKVISHLREIIYRKYIYDSKLIQITLINQQLKIFIYSHWLFFNEIKINKFTEDICTLIVKQKNPLIRLKYLHRLYVIIKWEIQNLTI